MRPQVGQEVFAELSRLETRGSAVSPPTLTRTKTAGGSGGGSRRLSAGGREGTPSGGVGGDGGRATGSVLVAVSEGGKGGGDTQKANPEEGGVGQEDEEEGVRELTLEEEVVRTCVSVCEMLEGCPRARHYVMSADR